MVNKYNTNKNLNTPTVLLKSLKSKRNFKMSRNLKIKSEHNNKTTVVNVINCVLKENHHVCPHKKTEASCFVLS